MLHSFPNSYFELFRAENMKQNKLLMVVMIIRELKQTVTPISINLLVVYRESVNLIGYITRRLSADSLQL